MVKSEGIDMPLIEKIAQMVSLSTKLINSTTDIIYLGLRIYIAEIFFLSGLSKIKSIQSTITLFQYEYEVPLIPPELAAYLGTAAELTLPVFIAVGLGARLPALALFIFNLIAAASYPFLHQPEGLAALKDHYIWGAILLMIVLHGHGRLSLDHLLKRKCDKYRY